MAKAQHVFAILALCLPCCSAHGHLTYPESSRQGGSLRAGGDCKESSGACYWFTNNIKIPGEPTLKAEFRSVNTQITGGVLDWTMKNPWRAPGTAPVLGHGCGVAGGGNEVYANGGFAPPGIRQGSDALDLPKTKTTIWAPGSIQEVGNAVSANHAGGYSWRLCKKDEASEECFQRGHLKFASDKQWIVYDDGSWLEIPLTKTSEGTFPEGSEWARWPVPSCNDCNPAETCGEPLEPTIGRNPDTPWNRQVNCNGFCAGAGSSKSGGTCEGQVQFPEPSPNASGFGKSIFPWSVVDQVVVPSDLEEGEYLLSWRWDCEQSDQVFQNCADIDIKIGGTGPETLLKPDSKLEGYKVNPRSEKGDVYKNPNKDDVTPCFKLGVEHCSSDPACEVMSKEHGGEVSQYCWAKAGGKSDKTGEHMKKDEKKGEHMKKDEKKGEHMKKDTKPDTEPEPEPEPKSKKGEFMKKDTEKDEHTNTDGNAQAFDTSSGMSLEVHAWVVVALLWLQMYIRQ